MEDLPSVSSMLRKAPKRIPQVGMVEGLNMTRIQNAILWRGMVRLHQLRRSG